MGRAVGLMVQRRVILGSVVAPFGSSRGPIEVKMILGGMSAQPVKARVRRFGLTSHYGVVGDTGGGRVIGL